MKNFFKAFIFLVATSVALAKVEVDIRNTVEVGSAFGLQLDDLVSTKNLSSETMRSLFDLSLPFRGSSVGQADFLEWLKTALQARPDLRNISFKVPQQIQVSRVNGLSRSQIKQRIQNRLVLKCSDCQYQIQISNVPTVSAGTANLEWKDIPLSGAFMVAVTTADGQNAGQNAGWISGQIKTQRQVVKTAHTVRVGDTLQETDLIAEVSDITFMKDYYLQKSEVLGKKVARTLSMGTLLTSADIQRDYDVRQGQSVKTIMGNESFEITLQTVAQDSGVTGDLIRVRNLTNQKIMSARIMEKGMVRIE